MRSIFLPNWIYETLYDTAKERCNPPWRCSFMHWMNKYSQMSKFVKKTLNFLYIIKQKKGCKFGKSML